MKCYLITTIATLLLTSALAFGQKATDEAKARLDNRIGCRLKPDDPAHFDPYYNGHLDENFDPKQVDFSKEYVELRTKWFAKYPNRLQQLIVYDFSPIWSTHEQEQNGVLGLNYKRIQFHIGKVNKSQMRGIYLVEGKSKVLENICSFKGEIRLSKAFLFDSSDESVHNPCGNLFATYKFYEDSSQNHSGVFEGVTECKFYLDSAGKQMQLEDSYKDADGYFNRTFVGIWTEYKTKKVKKCIWGDYRLPFTFDFDDGDGELRPSDKYRMNGWKTYGMGSEFVSVGHDKYELRIKWWNLKGK